MNEMERIIEETDKLNKSIQVAQELKTSFFKYLLITSVVTAVLTIGIAWGLAAALGSQQQEQHIEENTKAVVCILSVPPDEREIADTRFCLETVGIDYNELPVPPRVKGGK